MYVLKSEILYNKLVVIAFFMLHNFYHIFSKNYTEMNFSAHQTNIIPSFLVECKRWSWVGLSWVE